MSRGKNRRKGRAKSLQSDSQAQPSASSKVKSRRTRPKRSAKALASTAAGGSAPSTSRQKRKSARLLKAVGHSDSQQFIQFSALKDTSFNAFPTSDDGTIMPTNLGNNRLKSGFKNSKPSLPSDVRGTTTSDSQRAASNLQPEVLDLTTDDDDEDDGGITLNVQNHDPSPIIVVSDDEEDREEGQVSDTDMVLDAESSLEEGEERETPQRDDVEVLQKSHSEVDEPTFIIDTTPSSAQIKLADLNPDQLESQLSYAFWQLDRDEVDLGRLTRCLHCQAEGHIEDACPQRACIHCHTTGQHRSDQCPSMRRCTTCRQRGHHTCAGMRNTTVPCDICATTGHGETGCPLRHYSRSLLNSSTTVSLWISCCVCASKSHLVGDCPRRSSASSLRWSLKPLDPDQVVNLSVQTGIEKREKAAQNKNMRPQGLLVRGKANNFKPVASPDDSESDALNMLSKPTQYGQSAQRDADRKRQNSSHHQGHTRADHRERYDRFAAPTSSDSYRPPHNDFYSTNSFGRPRSRSPKRTYQDRDSSADSYRPGRRQSPIRGGNRSLESRMTQSNGLSIRLPQRQGGPSNSRSNGPRKPRKR